jgi:riboflavin kinase / FMN adenylyltransferase
MPQTREDLETADVWTVTGVVVHGEKRGRAIGFPTANLHVASPAALPPDGIYAGVARCLDGPSLCAAAAISVGTNPTFAGQERTLEAYLLDFDGDLYGRELHVQSLRRLRGVTRFPDIRSLVEAIAEDVAATRLLVGNVGPVAPDAGAHSSSPNGG